MSKVILGIHDGHNSAAALLKDGKLVDVLQEERLKRIKNFGNFPVAVVNDIIARHNCNSGDLTLSLNGAYMRYGVWDRESILQDYENSKNRKTFTKTLVRSNKTILSLYKSKKNKARMSIIKKHLNPIPSNIQSIEHHTAHAAAAYYGWGKKDKVLVLTNDGCGDELCATVSIGDKGELRRIASISEDNSI